MLHSHFVLRRETPSKVFALKTLSALNGLSLRRRRTGTVHG